MNGAEVLVETLVAGGVEVCFANPGTSELHFVGALDRNPRLRSILCLFEGVATGAADGYARIAGKPAATLLHLGPGLANGIANLHNAKRARSGIVNVIGDHATYHRAFDAPLASDIEMLAGQYSGWLKTSRSAADIGADAAAAIAAASSQPIGRIATLMLPADVAWSADAHVGSPQIPPQPSPAGDAAIAEAATLLRRPGPKALLLGNGLAQGPTLKLAAEVAAAVDARLLVPFAFSRLERGAGRPIVSRIPYVIEQALASLADLTQIVLIGAPAPVAFFAYPDMPSTLLPSGCATAALTLPEQDHVAALEELLGALGTGSADVPRQAVHRPEWPHGPVTLPGLAQAVAAVLPENAIVVDESLTSGRGMVAATAGCPPHDYLVNPGGAIGIALPLAIGAAIAGPGRPVLCLESDGSGMYAPQSLWTMAREGLPITTVIFANRSYTILKGEFAKLLPQEIGPKAASMLNIDRPVIDWVSLAGALGVFGCRVESLEAFTAALEAGLASGRPNLIEVVL